MLQPSVLLFSIILVFSPAVCGRTEWIDPHSMDDDPRLPCDCSHHLHNPTNSQPTSAIASYYIRTMNLLLKSLRNENEVHSAQFDVSLVKEEYEFIQSFLKQLAENSDKVTTSQDLDRIDKLITKMFTNQENTYLWQLVSWKDYLYLNIMSKEFAIGLGVMFVVWFLYKLKNTQFRFLTMFKYFLFVSFVVDFFYTWIYMLQEKELQQLLHVTYKIPPECNVKKMNYYAYFQYLADSFTGHDRCAEYHKIKDIDIFWSVSPSQVFGTQFGNLIVAPSEKIGNAFSKIIGGVFKEASWFMVLPTVLLMPILLFGLIVGGCVMLSFITGRAFSFNLMHFIQFSFGGEGGNDNRNQNQQPTINVTLPQIQLHADRGRNSSTRRNERLALERKNKTLVAAIDDKPKVEVEDVVEVEEAASSSSSSSGEEEIVVLREDAAKTSSIGSKPEQPKVRNLEDDYEVIS